MTAWDARTHQVRATGPRRPDHRPGWHLRPRQPARTGHTGARQHSRQPGWTDMRGIIADDSLLLRGGVARLLADSDAGVDVVATADNATMLAREVDTSDPDAVIVDIRMPPTHTDEGLTAARTLHTQRPRLGILVLSQYLQSHYALTLLSDAPEHVGYLLKDRVSHIGVLVDALNRVVAGECLIDPTIVSTLLRRPRDKGRSSDSPNGSKTSWADGRGTLQRRHRRAPLPKREDGRDLRPADHARARTPQLPPGQPTRPRRPGVPPPNRAQLRQHPVTTTVRARTGWWTMQATRSQPATQVVVLSNNFTTRRKR